MDIRNDRGQSIVPPPIVSADDRRRVEPDSHVRQSIQAIVERAGLEKSVATEPGGTVAPEKAGMVVEQGRFHGMLVQGRAGGNKGP